jgi:hypothetical protein
VLLAGGTAGRSYQWSVTVMAATSALPRTPM